MNIKLKRKILNMKFLNRLNIDFISKTTIEDLEQRLENN